MAEHEYLATLKTVKEVKLIYNAVKIVKLPCGTTYHQSVFSLSDSTVARYS